MATPVYSERFVNVSRTSGTSTADYTVPSGKRAIVRQFTLLDISPGGTGGTVALVAPATTAFVIVGTVAGTQGFHVEDLHLVYYAGEVIGTYRINGSVQVQIHGYLLDDP